MSGAALRVGPACSGVDHGLFWLCILCGAGLSWHVRVFDKDGVQVLVDESSLEFVRGATLDFVEEMMRSAFAVVNNPQSESACGCGSSFALKQFTTNPAKD